MYRCNIFFFNDTATTEIYTLSLHDALPILTRASSHILFIGNVNRRPTQVACSTPCHPPFVRHDVMASPNVPMRSEEHTSELQSRQYLVCRLLLEKKK